MRKVKQKKLKLAFEALVGRPPAKMEFTKTEDGKRFYDPSEWRRLKKSARLV